MVLFFGKVGTLRLFNLSRICESKWACHDSVIYQFLMHKPKSKTLRRKFQYLKVKTKLTWFRKCFQIVLKVQRINMNRFHILFCIACCKDDSIMLQSTLPYCYNHFLLHNASKNYNIHCWGFKIKSYWKLEQYSQHFTFQVKNLSFELKLICNVTVYSFHHASIIKSFQIVSEKQAAD